MFTKFRYLWKETWLWWKDLFILDCPRKSGHGVNGYSCCSYSAG